VRLFRRIKRWLKTIDDRGAAAVEFGIDGSAFMMMLLACFEFGYMLFIQSVLDNAARDAARLIRTGQVQTSGSPTSTYSTLLCNEVGAVIGCGNLVYQALVFNDWTSAQTSLETPLTRSSNGTFTSSGFNPGTAGQIMVVTVAYNYSFFTPWIASLLGSSSNSAGLISTVVFQNEPY
jgi:Flp pilus assembly protein TadG